MKTNTRKNELQMALESTTNYIFETGDTSVLELDSYREVKAELAELLKVRPPKAATNYGGGGTHGPSEA